MSAMTQRIARGHARADVNVQAADGLRFCYVAASNKQQAC